MQKEKIRLAIFISGSGTTMDAVLCACLHGVLKELVEVVLVVSSRSTARGIDKARERGVENIAVIRPKDYRDQDTFGETILAACYHHKVTHIIQCGWMPFTPPNVVRAYLGRIYNQHPGPLANGQPDFGGKGMYGIRVHAARLYFVRRTGRAFWTAVVLHHVEPDTTYDRGEVVHCRQVMIEPTDDPKSLQERALEEEHAMVIEALKMIAENRVRTIQPRDPIVRPEEEFILHEAQRVAMLLFP